MRLTNTIQEFVYQHESIYPGISTDNFYQYIANDHSLHHSYNCFAQIKNSRKLPIPGITKTTKLATAIVENRNLPGVEYIVRKLIHLLGDRWSHYIFCTSENIDMMTNICQGIHENINLIKLESYTITHNVYNNLCLSEEFWNKISAEQILIYQSDCEINHGGIDKFLQYDYIGAPWPVNQDDNSLGVGNGGFSLRTKQCMLDCLHTVPPDELQLNQSTLNYINSLRHQQRPLDNPPEDVYYSKVMIDYKLGVVADREVALEFACETHRHKSTVSLGEHQPWLGDAGKMYHNRLIDNISLMNNQFSAGDASQHAGGWPDVIQGLQYRGVLSDTAKTKLIDCTEQYFAWENNPPVTDEWIGIIHITPITPDYLNIANVDFLLENKSFLESLNRCKCIVVMSNYLKRYIQTKLPGINIEMVKHPTTNLPSTDCFNINKFKAKKNPQLLQIGQQMRYMSTIFEINYTGTKKWLTGWRDSKKMIDLLYKELQWLNKSCSNIDHDIITYLESKQEYNSIIKNNIVYVHAIDASANNSVLEMMVRNIPIFVNKHPAIEEYLGSHYPGYFQSISHLQYIINDRNVLNDIMSRSHMYLKSLDKYDISHDSFAGELIRINNQYHAKQ